MAADTRRGEVLLLGLFLFAVTVAFPATDPKDLAMHKLLRDGLSNPELLEWSDGDSDPCGSGWNHVLCSGPRVSQIQVQGLGFKGPLSASLTQLTDLGLQRNDFTGATLSLRGLSALKRAYFDYNSFEWISSDFSADLDFCRDVINWS